MHRIAHRGFVGTNAENTLPAVRAAVETADSVEIDVRRCGSGDLVVHHDATVDRTTDTDYCSDVPVRAAPGSALSGTNLQ